MVGQVRMRMSLNRIFSKHVIRQSLSLLCDLFCSLSFDQLFSNPEENERERGDDPEKGTLKEEGSKWSVGIVLARSLHFCDSRQTEGKGRRRNCNQSILVDVDDEAAAECTAEQSMEEKRALAF